jgi:AcrR family transcriptional regulator
MSVKATPARQERSAATFERALSAGAELLAEAGYEGFTVQEVCRRSKVSTSSLYARVDGKDTLVRLIHDRETARIEAAFDASIAAVDRHGLSTDQAIGGAVDAVGRTFRDNAALLRTFILRSSFDPVVHDRAHASISATSRSFTAALLRRRAEIAHDDPEAAVDMVFRIVFATFTRQLTRGPAFDSAHATGWDELTAELTRMCAGYLLAPYGA